MQIAQITPSCLVAKSNVILLWILGILSLSFGILVSFGWLLLPELSLEYKILTIIPGLLFLSISVQAFSTPTVVTTFDKSNGYFIQERKWLWKSETIQHSMQEIKNVEVIRKGNFGKGRGYFKIVFELDSGERLPLSIVNYRFEAIMNRQANLLRTFLEIAKCQSEIA